MSDDTPTQRFEQPAPGPTGAPREPRKRGPLVPILITAGAILLVAVAVLVVVLLLRTATSTQSLSTQSPTPSEVGTATPGSGTPSRSTAPSNPPPAADGPSISFFLVNGSTNPVLYCNTSAPSPTPLTLKITWSSKNVSDVYYGVGTTDAQAGALYSNLPASGDNSNFPDGGQTQTYPCPQHSQTYTLTVVGGTNGKVSKTVTVVNKGDQS